MRASAPPEVVRRRARHLFQGSDPRCDQFRILHFPDTDGNVDLLARKVDNAIDEHQPNIEPRILAQKFRHDGNNVKPAEPDRSGDRDIAGKLAGKADDGGLRAVQVIKQGSAGLQIAVARRSEGNPPGGPLDQSEPELLLELDQEPADIGQRFAELPRGTRETAGISHGNEDADCSQLVQAALPNNGKIITEYPIYRIYPLWASFCHTDLNGDKALMTATLYDLELSGNCYKVRLLCALLGVPLNIVPVDFLAGDHKRPPVIDLNPFGELPVFQHADVVLRDSQAILIYIARLWGGESWLPTDAVGLARVCEWLMVAENEIARGPNDARLHDKFGYEIDCAQARSKAARILGIMERHLSGHDWLALGRPTIADVACMPYVALGHEGGVTLDPYPAVASWVSRVKALPGFITMPAL